VQRAKECSLVFFLASGAAHFSLCSSSSRLLSTLAVSLRHAELGMRFVWVVKGLERFYKNTRIIFFNRLSPAACVLT
jgi:hypothetical protein